MGYTRKVINGISWVGLLRGSFRVVSFLKTVILARLLTPLQFGVFGIAALILGFLEMITETGINVFLVQEEREDSIEHFLHTAWIVSIFRGCLIAVVIFILAPILATFFNNPGSANIIRLIALVPLVRGLINPAEAKFQKHLQFHQEFWFRISITLVETITAIILSLILHQAVSLAWGMLAGSVAEVFLSHLVIKPRPKLIFDLSQWHLIIHRGKWVTSAGVLSYLANQPDFVIGKMLSSTSLGLYQMAFNLSTLPVTELNEVFNRVTFPIYVRIIGDSHRSFIAFVKNSLVVSVLLLPITIILVLFPKELLSIVVGHQWLAAAPLVQLIAIFGFIASIGSSSSPLFLAAKRQDYLSHVCLVQLISLAISIVPFINWYGINGAVYSLILASLLTIPFKGYYVWKILSVANPLKEPAITATSAVN